MRALLTPLLALSMLLAADTERPYFETVAAAPGFLPRSTPEAVGLDAQRLQAFVESARLANSDALIVLKDGKVVIERYFDQPKGPIACMGITQAVASLAIGKPASGQPLDDYMQDKLFLPMGIVDWKWQRDPSGNPDTVEGLSLRPRDLAKIGQLMLDQGRWRGKQLVSIGYVTEATAPSRERYPNQGLGWQIRYTHDANMRRYFGHEGRLGQYLAVDPTTRLVAVRMIRDQRPDQDNPRDRFDSFHDLFERLSIR